jgi:hypothetical protein
LAFEFPFELFVLFLTQHVLCVILSFEKKVFFHAHHFDLLHSSDSLPSVSCVTLNFTSKNPFESKLAACCGQWAENIGSAFGSVRAEE